MRCKEKLKNNNNKKKEFLTVSRSGLKSVMVIISPGILFVLGLKGFKIFDTNVVEIAPNQHKTIKHLKKNKKIKIGSVISFYSTFLFF